MAASRKLYVRLAENIAIDVKRAEPDPAALAAVDELVRGSLVPVFRADNPNFDARRFLAACGLSGE